MLIEAYMAVDDNTHDVNGFLYEITCDSGFSLTEYVSLEAEALPDWLSPDGNNHAFSDLLTLVPPGECHVVATPMQDETTPSEVCEPVEQDVTIEPESTTEIVLISQCEGQAAGALDVVAGLNTPPVLVDLDINPSKFIIQCEWVTITAEAVDPDGDVVIYSWEVTLFPGGAAGDYTIIEDGASAEFQADTPGYYEITVTVADASGGSSSLTFPIHVSGDQDIEHCYDPRCCETADGFQLLSEDECAETGGAIAPAEMCEAYVCCESLVVAEPEPFTTYELVLADECDPDLVVDAALCEEPEGCCRLPDGSYADLTEDECKELGGQESDERLCEDVCCETRTADGSVDFLAVPLGECRGLGGVLADAALCEETCCRLREGGFATLPVSECNEFVGVPVDADFCGEETVRIEGVTLDPDAECPPSPYMVIASSAAHELAVYDLATLLPLPTSPFSTCSDPSRILMLPNTDVVASCRGDGRINRHTRDGVLQWSTALPGCTSGARGVTFSPEGRLFAGCSSPGMVHELDLATGSIINSVDPGNTIYGISSDWDGLYICASWDSQVRKINLDAGGATDLTLDWQVNQPCYGISGDGTGGVWISQGSSLSRLDTNTGALLTTVPMGNPGYGTIVGPDGVVSVGLTTTNAVFRYDPLAATGATLAAPAGNTWSHGVTVDSAGNTYAICRSSNSVVKFEGALPPVSFGGGILNLPYNYGGDQAGINYTCVNSTTSIETLAPIDSGSATSSWLEAEWSATVPPDTSVLIEYRIDGGAWQLLANLSLTPGLTTTPIPGPNTGQVFEFRTTLAMSPAAATPPSIDWLTVTYSP
ncbi:MAG: streptogramin lyase [Bradymonadia bacterium]|jgi:streptogramin lyase